MYYVSKRTGWLNGFKKWHFFAYFLNVGAKFSLQNIFHFLNGILFDIINIYIVILKNRGTQKVQFFYVKILLCYDLLTLWVEWVRKFAGVIYRFIVSTENTSLKDGKNLNETLERLWTHCGLSLTYLMPQ